MRALRRPRCTLTILVLAVFSEAMSSTLILPFIYFMVEGFLGDGDARDIGSYAGIISMLPSPLANAPAADGEPASSFWAAQFLSTTVWGMVSDRCGRRPVLLIGLAGNALLLPAFGAARSLPLALAARSLCGLLNGNVGVVRTALAELAEQSGAVTHRRAFSLFGVGHALGSLGA